MRLFVAIDLPDALSEGVAAAQEPFAAAPGVASVNPGQAHLTLKFLGDVDAERLSAVEDAIERAVDAADVGPFEAAVGGYGVFPSLDYVSVVWTGLRTGGPEATRLHEAIEAETVDLGFDPEAHEFTPHVTLARVKDARSKALVQRTVREGDPDVGRFRVASVRLKESTLTSAGPEYETVAEFAL